jgi:sortase (surface protein transpeptidase)
LVIEPVTHQQQQQKQQQQQQKQQQPQKQQQQQQQHAVVSSATSSTSTSGGVTITALKSQPPLTTQPADPTVRHNPATVPTTARVVRVLQSSRAG